ncbi:hypothetical protein PHMEG_0004699 [Phytophthora megakarya]|uniref:Uncharacterized protein n=1 Tax=Phytophthora megakarya TaxID=4795 RepID=A0A225WUU3_9STRA|nr:hypothetical protein PHMEG_0004699 [Phytophthora megakarya]
MVPEKFVQVGPVSSVFSDDRDVGGNVDTVFDEIQQAVRPIPVCAPEAVDFDAVLANIDVDLETYVSVKSEGAEKFHEGAWLSVKVAGIRLYMLPSRYRALVREVSHDDMTHMLNRYEPGCSHVDRSVSFVVWKRSVEDHRTETFPERSLSGETEDDLYQFMYTVRESGAVGRQQWPEQYEVPDSDVESDSSDDLVGDGKRVIVSVNGVEAVSAWYIDCTPADVLIDSDAVASLIDVRVLKRIERADTPLRPCDSSLNGGTGHKIGAKGVIELPLRLGSVEMD